MEITALYCIQALHLYCRSGKNKYFDTILKVAIATGKPVSAISFCIFGLDTTTGEDRKAEEIEAMISPNDHTFHVKLMKARYNTKQKLGDSYGINTRSSELYSCLDERA
ncbi:hypothetical protein J6590_069895 [Homalodisca vitripennis]|nr:hypothetical protein J6590_069895 [Homalodisca vitripennis]